MQTIKLKNDVVHPVTWCGEANGALYFELKDVTDYETALHEFWNNDNTSVILYEGSETSKEYAGYTLLIGLQLDYSTGYITVTMRKAEMG